MGLRTVHVGREKAAVLSTHHRAATEAFEQAKAAQRHADERVGLFEILVGAVINDSVIVRVVEINVDNGTLVVEEE